MTDDEQPNYRDTEVARFNLEDLKAASRGSWAITDTLDTDTIAKIAAIRDSEPTLSVNGRNYVIDALDNDEE
jgi:hypothetical protein